MPDLYSGLNPNQTDRFPARRSLDLDNLERYNSPYEDLEHTRVNPHPGNMNTATPAMRMDANNIMQPLDLAQQPSDAVVFPQSIGNDPQTSDTDFHSPQFLREGQLPNLQSAISGMPLKVIVHHIAQTKKIGKIIGIEILVHHILQNPDKITSHR